MHTNINGQLTPSSTCLPAWLPALNPKQQPLPTTAISKPQGFRFALKPAFQNVHPSNSPQSHRSSPRAPAQQDISNPPPSATHQQHRAPSPADAETHRQSTCSRNKLQPHTMADRGSHRGGRGGGGGRGDGNNSRGGRGGRGGGHQGNREQGEKPKKENILDLAKYMDKQITVKFNGGREVVGTLKGYDALMNLVLDDVQETVRDEDGNESKRPLGLVVARGTLLVLISPIDGSEEIANPFVQAEDE
ncbi:Putative U6 snRNA-associated Sm-like protein LSm7 [[Torrubiella] hemipterigena]|nr:Putative U6 snRNA-associated Sm-like protein LSm7 [[Torrubiella] hemipterigena]